MTSVVILMRGTFLTKIATYGFPSVNLTGGIEILISLFKMFGEIHVHAVLMH